MKIAARGGTRRLVRRAARDESRAQSGGAAAARWLSPVTRAQRWLSPVTRAQRWLSPVVIAGALVVGGVARSADPASVVATQGRFEEGRAAFEMRCDQTTSELRRLAIPVMPGTTFRFEVLQRGSRRRLDARVEATAGTLTGTVGDYRWSVPADPGFAEIRIRTASPPDSMSLLMMVLTPLTSATDEHLGGYRLGTYPAQALRGLEVYRPPRGLVRVEAQDVERWVSPHFQLGQFLCKQEGSYPKFLLVRPRLLQKLERLLGRINREGISTPTLHVMSGYRTPFYNHAIGNVKYSRHIYGDAADVFVDASPQDGMMDDVNHDGTIDKRDAQFLAGLVESMFHESFFTPLVGGVGTYAANEAHGPFLHVDTRGTRARW